MIARRAAAGARGSKCQDAYRRRPKDNRAKSKRSAWRAALTAQSLFASTRGRPIESRGRQSIFRVHGEERGGWARKRAVSKFATIAVIRARTSVGRLSKPVIWTVPLRQNVRPPIFDNHHRRKANGQCGAEGS